MCLKMLVLLPLLLMVSCKTVGLRLDNKKIAPPQNAESPSKIEENKSQKVTEIKPGSTYTKETIAPTATEPAKTVERITYTEPAKIVEDIVQTLAVVAPSRKPDVTVALQQEQNKERRILLYLGSGAILLCAVMIYLGQRGPATIAGIGGISLIGLWYIAGDEFMMRIALGVVGLAIVWWLYNKHMESSKLAKRKALLESAMIKTVQSVEEQTVDNPNYARDLKDYLDSNMDESHKILINELLTKADLSYVIKRASEKAKSSHANSS